MITRRGATRPVAIHVQAEDEHQATQMAKDNYPRHTVKRMQFLPFTKVSGGLQADWLRGTEQETEEEAA
jgi:hypothetical protein